MTSRLALGLDRVGIKSCELKGHEVPVDLDTFAETAGVGPEDTLSYVIETQGGRVVAYLAFIHSDNELTLARMSECGIGLSNMPEFIREAISMLPESQATILRIVINEIDMPRYIEVVNQLAGVFVGGVSGQEQCAYGQTFHSYSYRVNL